MNQNPGTDGFTSPPKDAARNASSFAGVELSRLQELHNPQPDPLPCGL